MNIKSHLKSTREVLELLLEVFERLFKSFTFLKIIDNWNIDRTILKQSYVYVNS